MYTHVYIHLRVFVHVSGIDPHFTASPNLPLHPSGSRAPGSKRVFLATLKSGTTQQRLPKITMTKLMRFDAGPVGATSPWTRIKCSSKDIFHCDLWKYKICTAHGMTWMFFNIEPR